MRTGVKRRRTGISLKRCHVRKVLDKVLLLFLVLFLYGNTPGKRPPPGMVRVPAGFLLYGKDGKKIFLKEFYIDKIEMSAKDYREVNEYFDGPYIFSSNQECHELWHLYGLDYPASCVRWKDAADTCKKLGKRLPTEMEWEMAARGTDGRPYPWGSEEPTCSHAVLYNCGYKYAQKACSKPKGNSPYGICDMLGNVGEWVISARDESTRDKHVMKGSSFLFFFLERTGKPYVWVRYTGKGPYWNYPDTHVGIGVRCVWSKTDHNIKLLPTVKERGF